MPADPRHDLLRAVPDLSAAPLGRFGAASDAPPRPFLTMPSDCGYDNGPFRISLDSWNDPGNFTPDVTSSDSVNVTGCDDPRIRLEPDIALQPTSRSAGGPTGLDVHLEAPQRDNTVANVNDLYAQNGSQHGIDTPPMKKAVVTLPQGMTLSTSAAQGLTGCSSAQIGLGTNSPVSCPDSSRYGSLTVHTPILPKDAPMQGDIYIAKQSHNPFGSFLAFYFVIHDEARGLLVKLPGRIDLDPVTGQIKTTFDDLPQFPVSDLQLTLKGGVRAALVNPSTCGQKTITATFYSWAAPDTPITKTSSYDVTQRADGSPCLNSLGDRPFNPQLSAGSVNLVAGAYSPFFFRLTRSDDDQEFSQLGVTMPPGLVAKIAGIGECPNAGISQAILRTAAGDGALEQSDPSCPASSQLGSSEVGSGVGQVVTYLGGKLYLAGPYQGAPLSIVVITPLLAGPYDLGVIAVRSAANVDPETGQIKILTDPFPQLDQAIPVTADAAH